MLKSRLVASSMLVFTLAAAGSANAGFDGHTVSADYLWPDLSTVYLASGTAVVGPGLEFDGIGFGPAIGPDVDFSDSTIRVTYPVGWLLAGTGSFDGWRFTDFTAGGITGVSLAGTNIAGFDASRLSFDDSHVFADTLGLGAWAPDSYIEIGVSFGVPEPGTWALMILGFGAAGVALRRRRGAPAS